MSGTKITVSLSQKTIETLDHFAETKGLKKSAVIALALAEMAERERREDMKGVTTG